MAENLDLIDPHAPIPIGALAPLAPEAHSQRWLASVQASKAARRSRSKEKSKEKKSRSFTPPAPSQRVELAVRVNNTMTTGQLPAKGERLRRNAVAVLSLQEGSGVSTIAFQLARALGAQREDVTALVDSSLARPALGNVLLGESLGMLQEVAAFHDEIDSRDALEVYSVDVDSNVDLFDAVADDYETLTSANLSAAARSIRRYYDTAVFDVGGAGESAGHEMLAAAHLPIVVMGPNSAGAGSCDVALEWLRAIGHDPARAIVVINGVPTDRSYQAIDQLVAYFAGKVAAVVCLPLDEELFQEGSPGIVKTEPSVKAFDSLVRVVLQSLCDHERDVVVDLTRDGLLQSEGEDSSSTNDPEVVAPTTAGAYRPAQGE